MASVAKALRLTPAAPYAGAAEAQMSRSLSDWEQWLVAGQAGDRAAYRRFLDAARGHLTRYFQRRAAHADAADLVQETLIALHNKRATYDPAYPLLPWLNTIARYKWIDWLRSNRRARFDELDEELHGEAAPDPAAGHAIGLLLQRLSPAQATVIRLVKIEGLSIEEAAAATGQSQSLVKVNIHRGIKRLSAFVDEEDD